MASTIYILEPNQEILMGVEEAAKEKGFFLETATDIDDLAKKVAKDQSVAVFISYDVRPKTLDEVGVLKNHFTVVYGENIDFDNRMYLYQIGISRVLSGELAKPKALVQIISFRIYSEKELKPLFTRSMIHGNLAEFQLPDILLTVLLEKRNIILKIEDDDWYAKLRIYQGEVVEATCPNRKGTDAVLEILRHQKGLLRMQSFVKDKETSSGDSSTFSYVVESQFQNSALKDFQKKYRLSNPIFSKKVSRISDRMSYQEQEIFNLINGEDGLLKLVLKSPYALLQTLYSLKNLMNQKQVKINYDSANINQFTDEDIDFIKERLLRPDSNEGRMIVLGSNESGKTEFLQTIAEIGEGELESIESFEISHLILADDLRLQFVGIQLDANFQKFIDDISSDTLACFILLKIEEHTENEYIKYFLRQFLSSFPAPVVVGITGVKKKSDELLENLRKDLEIPQEINIIPFDPVDFQQVRQMFYGLVESPKK
jgi:signal recognition particle receptor subunit beta